MLKAILIVLLLAVFYQDYKAQLVSWYLFPLTAIAFGINFYVMIGENLPYFLYSVAFNCCMVLLVLLVLFLYSRLKMKMKFINAAFGVGDVLMLFAIAFGFPPYTFLILLSISVLFALGCHFILKRKYPYRTVPLAGYMALFFSVLLAVDHMPFFPNLYAY